MFNIEYKTYILGKRTGMDYCEDSLAEKINADESRFAVADGVSNSFRPEFVSRYLVDTFISSGAETHNWPKMLKEELGKDLEEKWKERVNDFLDGYVGFAREIQEERLESVGAGASTFCGISIKKDKLDYAVLGDSCLFISFKNEKFRIISSCETKETETGEEANFTSVTSCIIVGQPESTHQEDWRLGSTELREGYVALMTDGASHWFQQQLLADREKAYTSLWKILDNPTDFSAYVMEQREAGGSPLNDDLAIILIKIDQKEKAEQSEPQRKEGKKARFTKSEKKKRPGKKERKVEKISLSKERAEKEAEKKKAQAEKAIKKVKVKQLRILESKIEEKVTPKNGITDVFKEIAKIWK